MAVYSDGKTYAGKRMIHYTLVEYGVPEEIHFGSGVTIVMSSLIRVCIEKRVRELLADPKVRAIGHLCIRHSALESVKLLGITWYNHQMEPQEPAPICPL